ncbi:MAG: HD domain-containing phosphohydrolase [Chloroflexota bacterium]
MLKRSSDTISINRQFQSLEYTLLKAMGDLARSADPRAILAIQELKKAASSIEHLQNGVSGHMREGKHQLAALMEIGHAINSSLGLDQVLEAVIDALISLMQAERGFLMLRDGSGEFSVAVARGIDQKGLEGDDFAFSKTIVNRAASTGETVLTTNAQTDPRFGMEMSVISFHLRSILCAPLRLKDEIIGVIFVDNRIQSGLFQENDVEVISAFADQAAVAIDNARLFEDLQKSNQELEAANEELETAYEATLAGWVRALDLRDKETEGHTQRVTTLTRQLAADFGMGGADLVHISRGALLHDIGKMAIPDSILLKPGGLTAEEREFMKRHTVLAYEMLEPIQFLRPAIDIPYCHHEKWDGTGYPRGLSGDGIPLNARIFSIVDVWDALTSDRPYRKALPRAEAQQYIREQAGVFFDPQITETFLGRTIQG